MNRIWARTLIDIDIIINFLSSEFIIKARILLKKKSNIYTVANIDKKLLEYNKDIVDHETEETQL